MSILDNIDQADLEKVSALIVGLATLGYKLYGVFQKYKQQNADLTMEQFVAEVTRVKQIPTDWDNIYSEE